MCVVIDLFCELNHDFAWYGDLVCTYQIFQDNTLDS